MTSTQFVRAALSSDAAQIAPLLEELGHPVEPESIARFLESTGRPGSNTLTAVCLEHDEVVGVVSAFATPVLHRRTPVGRVSVMAVSSKRTGRGAGTLLLRFAEEFLAAQGCERIEVTSAAHRERAHAFYRARGYSSQGVRLARELGSPS